MPERQQWAEAEGGCRVTVLRSAVVWPHFLCFFIVKEVQDGFVAVFFVFFVIFVIFIDELQN